MMIFIDHIIRKSSGVHAYNLIYLSLICTPIPEHNVHHASSSPHILLQRSVQAICIEERKRFGQ